MREVWVITGSWSDYDSSDTWIVCAYPERPEAERHASLLNDEVKAMLDAKRGSYGDEVELAHDPGRAHLDYVLKGLMYSVEAMPIMDSVDQTDELSAWAKSTNDRVLAEWRAMREREDAEYKEMLRKKREAGKKLKVISIKVESDKEGE